MPYSVDEGKHKFIELVSAVHPMSILDVGPGSGSYARMLRDAGYDTEIVAIEVHEPYVQQFGLENIYTTVIVGNFLEQDWLVETGKFDIVVLGDVIEHFNDEDALKCWDLARRFAGPDGHVICSTPIIEFPQGAQYGNEHEAHLSFFPPERLQALDGVYSYWGGEVVGVVLAHGK